MKLTQSLTLHVNGGNAFSELHYEILREGQPTGITIYKRTTGRPLYRYTDFLVRCGAETLDVLTAPKGSMMPWIEQRVPPLSPPPATSGIGGAEGETL